MRDLAKSYAMVGCGALTSLAFTFSILSFYSIDTLGTYSAFVAYALIASSVIKLGIMNLVLKEAAKSYWASAEVFWYGLSFLVIPYVFVLILWVTIGPFIEVDGIFVVSIAVLSIIIFDFSVAVCRGYVSVFHATFFDNVLRPVLLLGSLFIYWLSDLQISISFIFPAAYFVASIYVIYVIRAIPSLGENSISVEGFKRFSREVISQHISLGLVNLSSSSLQNLFTVIADSRFGPSAAGVLKISFQVGSLMSLSSAAVQSRYSTEMARLYYRQQFADLRTLVGRCTMFMSALGLFAYIVLFVGLYTHINFFGAEKEINYMIGLSCVGFLAQALVGPAGHLINLIGIEKVNLTLFASSSLLACLVLISDAPVPHGVLGLCCMFSLTLITISLIQKLAVTQHLRRIGIN